MKQWEISKSKKKCMCCRNMVWICRFNGRKISISLDEFVLEIDGDDKKLAQYSVSVPENSS